MNGAALTAVANSVRSLTIDAVEKAKSGHPGLPMGCAELGALVYGELLNHWPQDPAVGQPRPVRSLRGARLHAPVLAPSPLGIRPGPGGYHAVPPARLAHPGSPGVGHDPGRRGHGRPAGPGNFQRRRDGNRRAHARREVQHARARQVVDHYTYVLASDGDMMEGVASEACSLAGHLGLGKLIVFYDSNKITIEGSTDLAFSENVLKRFEGYGWQTFSGDMYDLPAIMKTVEQVKAGSTGRRSSC